MVIDEAVCSDDLAPSLMSVPACQELMLLKISLHPKMMYAILQNDAPWTRACSKVANIRNQNSVKNVRARLVTRLDELMNLLLRIISRISKNLRVQLPFYSVSTPEYKSVFVHIDKFIVKKLCPLSMEEFSVTMHEK